MHINEIKNSRPHVTESYYLPDAQLFEIQSMIDHSCDWLHLYIKAQLDTKMESIEKEIKDKANELQKYTYDNVDILKK